MPSIIAPDTVRALFQPDLAHHTAPQRSLAGPRISYSKRIGLALKRTTDIAGAAILLLLLAPLMPTLALFVRLDGGPALYRHLRIGYGDRPFGCLKFRTMVTDADSLLASHLANNPKAAAEWATHRKLTADPRVTRIGAVLRATSLDELPQLLNVLRGQMSLVGPRPVVREELEQHYGDVGRAAYAATRPGITGLWQISGRNDTTYQERVGLDIAYVGSWSLFLDLKILLRTIPAVLSRRGAV
jgi:lipopolysaccharide/colanic/teichoic acid biosynthesis glycosyltransferase